MTTEYQVRLDRDACEGVFACLVRDNRFTEASDGLATIDTADSADGDEELISGFADERIEDARQAARACPVGAINVTAVDDE
jgi:ferredoxin